jgi:hypothetical protein
VLLALTDGETTSCVGLYHTTIERDPDPEVCPAIRESHDVRAEENVIGARGSDEVTSMPLSELASSLLLVLPCSLRVRPHDMLADQY